MDGTLKGGWLVYLKLGLLGDDGFLRKEEPRRPMQVFGFCMVWDSWSHLEDIPAI